MLSWNLRNVWIYCVGQCRSQKWTLLMLTWTCLRDFFVAGNCTKGTRRHLAGKGLMWHCIFKQGKRSSNTVFLGGERVNVTLAFLSRESVHLTLHSLAGKGLMWHLRSLAGKRLMGQHCKHCKNRDCTNENVAFWGFWFVCYLWSFLANWEEVYYPISIPKLCDTTECWCTWVD